MEEISRAELGSKIISTKHSGSPIFSPSFEVDGNQIQNQNTIPNDDRVSNVIFSIVSLLYFPRLAFLITKILKKLAFQIGISFLIIFAFTVLYDKESLLQVRDPVRTNSLKIVANNCRIEMVAKSVDEISEDSLEVSLVSKEGFFNRIFFEKDSSTPLRIRGDKDPSGCKIEYRFSPIQNRDLSVECSGICQLFFKGNTSQVHSLIRLQLDDGSLVLSDFNVENLFISGNSLNFIAENSRLSKLDLISSKIYLSLPDDTPTIVNDLYNKTSFGLQRDLLSPVVAPSPTEVIGKLPISTYLKIPEAMNSYCLSPTSALCSEPPRTITVVSDQAFIKTSSDFLDFDDNANVFFSEETLSDILSAATARNDLVIVEIKNLRLGIANENLKVIIFLTRLISIYNLVFLDLFTFEAKSRDFAIKTIEAAPRFTDNDLKFASLTFEQQKKVLEPLQQQVLETLTKNRVAISVKELLFFDKTVTKNLPDKDPLFYYSQNFVILSIGFCCLVIAITIFCYSLKFCFQIIISAMKERALDEQKRLAIRQQIIQKNFSMTDLKHYENEKPIEVSFFDLILNSRLLLEWGDILFLSYNRESGRYQNELFNHMFSINAKEVYPHPVPYSQFVWYFWVFNLQKNVDIKEPDVNLINEKLKGFGYKISPDKEMEEHVIYFVKIVNFSPSQILKQKPLFGFSSSGRSLNFFIKNHIKRSTNKSNFIRYIDFCSLYFQFCDLIKIEKENLDPEMLKRIFHFRIEKVKKLSISPEGFKTPKFVVDFPKIESKISSSINFAHQSHFDDTFDRISLYQLFKKLNIFILPLYLLICFSRYIVYVLKFVFDVSWRQTLVGFHLKDLKSFHLEDEYSTRYSFLQQFPNFLLVVIGNDIIIVFSYLLWNSKIRTLKFLSKVIILFFNSLFIVILIEMFILGILTISLYIFFTLRSAQTNDTGIIQTAFIFCNLLVVCYNWKQFSQESKHLQQKIESKVSAKVDKLISTTFGALPHVLLDVEKKLDVLETQEKIEAFSSNIVDEISNHLSEYIENEFLLKTLNNFFVGRPFCGEAKDLVNQLSVYKKMNQVDEFDVSLAEFYLGKNITKTNVLGKARKLRLHSFRLSSHNEIEKRLLMSLELCIRLSSTDCTEDQLHRFGTQILENSIEKKELIKFYQCLLRLAFTFAKNPSGPISSETLNDLMAAIAENFHQDSQVLKEVLRCISLQVDNKESKPTRKLSIANTVSKSVSTKNSSSDSEHHLLNFATRVTFETLQNSKNFAFFEIPIVKKIIKSRQHISNLIMKMLYCQSMIFRNQQKSKPLINVERPPELEELNIVTMVSLIEISEGNTSSTFTSSFVLDLLEKESLSNHTSCMDLFHILFSRNQRVISELFEKHSLPHLSLFLLLKKNKNARIYEAYRAYDSRFAEINRIRKMQTDLRNVHQKLEKMNSLLSFKHHSIAVKRSLIPFFETYFFFKAISQLKLEEVASQINTFFNRIIDIFSYSTRQKLFRIFFSLAKIISDRSSHICCEERIGKLFCIGSYLKNPTVKHSSFFEKHFQIFNISDSEIKDIVIVLQEAKSRQLTSLNFDRTNLYFIEEKLSFLLFHFIVGSDNGINTKIALDNLCLILIQDQAFRSRSHRSTRHRVPSLEELRIVTSLEELDAASSSKNDPKRPDSKRKSLVDINVMSFAPCEDTRLDRDTIIKHFYDSFFNKDLESASIIYIFAIISGICDRKDFHLCNQLEQKIQTSTGLNPLIFQLLSKSVPELSKDIQNLFMEHIQKSCFGYDKDVRQYIQSVFSSKSFEIMKFSLNSDSCIKSLLSSNIENENLVELLTFLVSLRTKNLSNFELSDAFRKKCLENLQIEVDEIIFLFRIATRKITDSEIQSMASKQDKFREALPFLISDSKLLFSSNDKIDRIISKSVLPHKVLALQSSIFSTIIALRRKNYPLAERMMNKIVIDKTPLLSKMSEIVVGLSKGFQSPNQTVQLKSSSGLEKSDLLLNFLVSIHLKYSSVTFISFLFDFMFWKATHQGLIQSMPSEIDRRDKKVIDFVQRKLSKFEENFQNLLKNSKIFPSISKLKQILSFEDSSEMKSIFKCWPSESSFCEAVNRALLTRWRELVEDSNLKKRINGIIHRLSTEPLHENRFAFDQNSIEQLFEGNESLQPLFQSSISTIFCDIIKSFKTAFGSSCVPSDHFGELFIGVILFRLAKIRDQKLADCPSQYQNILFLVDRLTTFIERQFFLKNHRSVINRHELARLFLLNFGTLMRKEQIYVFSVSIFAPHIMIDWIRAFTKVIPETSIRGDSNEKSIDLISVLRSVDFLSDFRKMIVFSKCWKQICKKEKNRKLKLFEFYRNSFKENYIFDTEYLPDLSLYSHSFKISDLPKNEPMVYGLDLREGITNEEIIKNEISHIKASSQGFFDAVFLQIKFLKYTRNIERYESYINESDLLSLYVSDQPYFEMKRKKLANDLSNYYQVAENLCPIDFRIKHIFTSCSTILNLMAINRPTKKFLREVYDLQRQRQCFDPKTFAKKARNFYPNMKTDEHLLSVIFEFLFSDNFSSLVIRRLSLVSTL